MGNSGAVKRYELVYKLKVSTHETIPCQYEVHTEYFSKSEEYKLMSRYKELKEQDDVVNLNVYAVFN